MMQITLLHFIAVLKLTQEEIQLMEQSPGYFSPLVIPREEEVVVVASQSSQTQDPTPPAPQPQTTPPTQLWPLTEPQQQPQPQPRPPHLIEQYTPTQSAAQDPTTRSRSQSRS